MKFNNKRLNRYMLIGCTVLIALITILVVSKKISDNNNMATASDIARKLGYADQSQLALYRACWDFQSSCGVYIHYTTDKSFSEFVNEVNNVGFADEGPEEIDSGTIFTNINASTNKTLTVDGIDPFGNLASVRMPRANQWIAHDKYGRRVTISFYNVMESKGAYEIDGTRIYGNIVTVMLRTK